MLSDWCSYVVVEIELGSRELGMDLEEEEMIPLVEWSVYLVIVVEACMSIRQMIR